ncbi:hypothetical protein D9M69_534740 [compost metagenome]
MASSWRSTTRCWPSPASCSPSACSPSSAPTSTASSSHSASPIRRRWRVWCAAQSFHCVSASSSKPRASWAMARSIRCCAISCRIALRRSRCLRLRCSAGRSCRKALSPSSASACRHRRRPGATCSPPAAPSSNRPSGSVSSPVSASRSPCSASTCLAMRCATGSTPACEA